MNRPTVVLDADHSRQVSAHAIDTSGWTVVPATVQDERGFTIQDYEEASEDFLRSGDPEDRELSDRAVHKAFARRRWLVTAQARGAN